MKLSVNTTMPRGYTLRESLDALYAVGYRNVDVSLWGYANHGGPLDSDNWREWCEIHKEQCDRLGLEVNQTHGSALGGMNWDDLNYPDREFTFSMLDRCIEASAIFGSKCMVVHPYNLPHAPIYDREKLKAACIEHLDPYINKAKKYGVKIAIENMVDFGGNRRRYCGGDISELCELVDTINDPDVGICLDTGHAHYSGANVAEAVRLIGVKRLIATHVDDNKKNADDHVLPFFGTIDWEPVMKALAEIGYDKDFTYETGSKNTAREFIPTYLKYTYDLGNALLNMAKK